MNTSAEKHGATLTVGRRIAQRSKQAMGKTLVYATLFATLGGGNAALGQAPCNANWNVVKGDWTLAGNWRPARLPGNNSDVCLTNGAAGKPATTNLTLANNTSIKSLTIGADNAFSVTSGKNPYEFKVAGNMTNQGTLNLSLQPIGKGNGESRFTVGKRLANSGTITGLGWLYIEGRLNNTGTGTIEANGGTLTIDPAKNAKIINDGIMAGRYEVR